MLRDSTQISTREPARLGFVVAMTVTYVFAGTTRLLVPKPDVPRFTPGAMPSVMIVGVGTEGPTVTVTLALALAVSPLPVPVAVATLVVVAVRVVEQPYVQVSLAWRTRSALESPDTYATGEQVGSATETPTSGTEPGFVTVYV